MLEPVATDIENNNFRLTKQDDYFQVKIDHY